MKKILSSFCFLLIIFLGQAQVSVDIDSKVVDYVTSKKLSGVTVNILDGATMVKSGVTTSNGNIKFNVPAGKKYKIEFVKAGKVVRFLSLDVKNIEKEMIAGANVVKMEVQVALFDELPNIDYSYIENNPITEFYFNGQDPSLIYDEVISNKMKKKIESLMAETEKKLSQNEAMYQKAIEAADGWYKEKKYDLALAKYEEALLLKPKEPYPTEKIKELDALLKAQKQGQLLSQQNEELYKKTLASADALRDQKKYPEAIAKYNEALKLKDEQYAKDQIVGVNKLIEAAKKEGEINAKYKEAISSGDALFAQKNYAGAKEKFTEATKLKSAEVYPKDKLLEIEAKIKEEGASADKKKKYTDKIAEADQLKNAGKLLEAKTKYNEAIALDNTQAYPKDKIKEIDLKIAEEAKAKERIVVLLREGAGLFAKSDLENAKLKYQEVLKLEAGNTEATNKLTEINAKIAQSQSLAQKEEQFKKLKAQGIDYMSKQSWPEAKKSFLEAKSIKADPEIETKLKEIEGKMAADEAYYKLLQEGQALEPTNIDGAISKYREALAKKPNDENVKKKIIDLENIKANKSNQAATDKKYNEAMKKGNTAFTEKKYTEAITFYNEAIQLKPNEKEPVDRAAEAEKLARAGTEKDVNEAYSKILDAGQKAIDEKNWTKAREMYNRALKLRPDDTTPKNKLKEIEALLKAEEDAKLSVVEKEKEFKARITEAEQAASLKDYDKAISLFSQAEQLKPADKLPPKRIQELKDLKLKAGNSAQQEAMYKEYMNNGSQANKDKNYSKALSEYKNALGIKPNDSAALAKIAEVEKLMAFESNNQTEQKIKADFDALVQEGDALFKASNWQEARKKYEAALGLISTDLYARKQVDKCIENLQKIPDGKKQYDKLIARADENFNKKQYDKAKELYERALTLLSNDQYPKDQLLAIEKALNPVPIVITTPVALPNLGIPTSGDPKEVQGELEKAELERQNRERIKLAEQRNNIQNNEINSSSEKTEEILSTVNNISEIKKGNAENYTEGDESRQKTVEKVDLIDKSIQELAVSTNTEKYNEVLNTKEVLKNIDSENSIAYSTAEKVYQDNSESYKTYQVNSQDEMAKNNQQKYDANIESQGKLTNLAIKYDEKVVDDFESRKVVEGAIDVTEKGIAENDQQNQDKESESISEMAGKIDQESVARSVKFQEDAKISGENKEVLKLIENGMVKSDILAAEKNIETSLTVDNLLSTKQKDMSELTVEQDQNRLSNTESLKTGANEINEDQRRIYSENVSKSLSNQDQIGAQKIKGDVRYDIEKDNFDKIVSELEVVDKKASTAFIDANLSDEEERLNTNAGVSNVQTGVTQKYIEDTKKKDQNAEVMKVITTDLTDKMGEANLDHSDKLTNSRLWLDEVSQQKVKFSDKIANEIGALYPEGVSQEIFNKTDEDGLLVSVVTRRIVVKKGFGQIYIRTQSLNGITYSKNGSPSSEYNWQRETEDALLQKNY